MSKPLGLIDDRLTPLIYTWQQQWEEYYTSGKDTIVVDRGLFTWRASDPPVSVSGVSVTFTNCDGTTTELLPEYGGNLAPAAPAVLLRYC